MNTDVVEEVFQRYAASVTEMALYFVGQPDDAMMTELRAVEDIIVAGLTEEFDAETAKAIAQRFVTAVVDGRRGMGSGGRA